MACEVCGMETREGEACGHCGFPDIPQPVAKALIIALRMAAGGQLEHAISKARQAVRDAPNSWLVHLRLGSLYERKMDAVDASMGRLAEREYAESLKLAPENRDVHTARISLASKTGSLEAVKAEYEVRQKEWPAAADFLGIIGALEKSAALRKEARKPDTAAMWKFRMYLLAGGFTLLGAAAMFILVLKRINEEGYEILNSMDFYSCVALVTATGIFVMEALRARGTLEE